jgi:8-oxo-dGTP pyrophosphatase MutT (NUDIX family)
MKKYFGRLGGGILFTDGKKILLLKRDGDSDNKGRWGIPGGRARENETPIEVAKRETKEECGSCEGVQFGHYQDVDGDHHFHTFLFAIKKPFDVEISKEHDDYKWASIKKIEEMRLHPRLKKAWPELLKAIKKKFPNKKSFKEWLDERDK